LGSFEKIEDLAAKAAQAAQGRFKDPVFWFEDMMGLMARNWLLAHWRRIAMQAALCALLLVTVGLAALVTHQKRLALRLPLTGVQSVGRLDVSLPKGWTTPAPVDRPEGSDSVVVDEAVPEPMTGRRLSVFRLRCSELISPLDFLLRASFLNERDITGKEPGGREQAAENATEPARLQRLDVAGWPGLMVSRTVGHLGGRRAQKQVLACSVLARGQAVVIKLEGLGAADAADEELVRQIAESTLVYENRNRASARPVLPQAPGALVELGEGVLAAVPEHFVVLPNDDASRTSRELMSDGSDGHWTAVELIPCIWLAGEPPEEQLLTMLAARDRTWHSGSVKRLSENMWQAERVTLAGEMRFPVRAYCFTDGSDQALLAILRGGWRDDVAFGTAWASVSSNVRFTQRRDLPALLKRGAEEAKRLSTLGLINMLPPKTIVRRWSLWDPAENTDKRDWMNYVFGPSTADGVVWSGSRLTVPTPWSAFGGGPTETIQQDWGGTSDFSTYWLRTEHTVSSRGEVNVKGSMQRFELHDGMFHKSLVSDDAQPVPDQYLPGGWLPAALAKVADQPMILRTESFLACDGAVPPGLLTLYVTRVAGEGAGCVSVAVNGSGRVTRWWYDSAGVVQAIDFGSDLRGQSFEPKPER
jgi:hypothetical protein